MRTLTDNRPQRHLPSHLTESRATLRGTRSRLSAHGEGAPRVMAQPQPLRDVFRAGQLLEGIYEIKGLLGSGGMGQVYEAIDRRLNRTVAIKVAWPHVGPEALRREAQVLAAFRHAGLVTAYALGREGDTEFLVMERLSGATLADRLRDGDGARALPIGEAIELLIAIGEALQVVHAAGLAHCDLKPSNIMLTPGRVVLLDFGIVRIEQLRVDEKLISGSPHYMAPEAIRGHVRRGEAHRVDLYALGVIAFVMLTGSAPFDHTDAVEIMIQHLEHPPPRVYERRDDVPPALDALVDALLAKHPDERPADIEVVLAELKALRGR